jgi:hypothetical protein
VTATINHFEARLAPCGKTHDGELRITEDHEGLITEEISYSCGCQSAKEEFHDGSCHRRTVNHHGKVLVDLELRGG